MRAMILAAGLGTRLLPLTNFRPKVLFPLRGVTMLDFWIERLHRSGFDRVVVNAFHLKEELGLTVSEKSRPIDVQVLYEPVLLGTGGGIRNALDALKDEPFVVINGDIVSDAPPDLLLKQHVESCAEVSLLLHDWSEFNNVAVDESGSILGFGKDLERLRQEGLQFRKLAFTGIHFISPSAIRPYSPGPGDILTVYRRLIAAGKPPKALFHNGLFWREMGSISSYMGLNSELARLVPDFLPPLCTGREITIDPDASVAGDVELTGSVVIGRGVRIAKNARLENTILWDDVQIIEGAHLRNCIVSQGMKISGSHSDEVLVPEEK